ncbi:MAG TPA: chemotaxis response regulator protein-glutamate methylesterase [Holophagaceae bacterium]|nr:chemotaxis response regulator protein-glutamate methylesterase [Holophagaceae bacterium]
MTAKRRVLVVDDSVLVRQLMTRILSRHPDLEVVGTAADPFEAREKIIALQPDVLTLDIEMPRMDGLTFLGKLMKAHPMPVVVVSSLTPKGTQVAMEALRLGAMEVIGKPSGSAGLGLERVGDELAEAVHEASFARVARRASVEVPRLPLAAAPLGTAPGRTDGLILMGASTGGTEALRRVFEGLPAGLPPIAIVQHILPGFTAAYAERLNGVGQVRVSEAADGELLLPGHAYLAPSLAHLRVRREGDGRIRALVQEGPRLRNHLPAVDALFQSAAEAGGARRMLGVLLTGMGDDGARGLLALRQAGAATLSQDEATSVVYGMPKVAWEIGASERQVALDEVAREVARWAGAK